MDSLSDTDSLIATPKAKRRKLSASNQESMAFDYDLKHNNVHSNIQHLLQNDTPCSVPQSGSGGGDGSRGHSDHAAESLSLSGLMVSAETDHETSCISPSAPRSPADSNPSPLSSNQKYKQFMSFPVDDEGDDGLNGDDGNESELLYDEEKHIDADDDILSLHGDPEGIEEGVDAPKERKERAKKDEMRREKEAERRLFEEGRFSLALPVIDCDRYKFDDDRAISVIAAVLKQFMVIHRHPKLRVIVMATDKYQAVLHRKLAAEYRSERGMDSDSVLTDSLDLDDGDDAIYKMLEMDHRIVIHGGSLPNIVTLRDRGLCSQFMVNFTFWNFSGKKGDRINKLIHRHCPQLESVSVSSWKTAKKKYRCYPVTLCAENGGRLYSEQNVRCIIHVRPPSMNPNMTDFEGDAETAYSALREVYSAALEAFYGSTKLVAPSTDSLIALDVGRWSTKQLTLSHNVEDIGPGDVMDGAATSKEANGVMDGDDLHFSLRPVPPYNIPAVCDWPRFQGFWKNALSVYVERPRDTKWAPCIFYEDDQFVIIYDRYFKAKIHLLILPKTKVQSVYDLDPTNGQHIALIEGMIARAKWIEQGLCRRDSGAGSAIRFGFHAIPSMNLLHLHVISDDMDSDNVKNKKHYLSFQSDYFVPGRAMLRILKEEQRAFTVNTAYYKALLKQSLKCHKCGHGIRTIPALKKHLKQCRYGKRRRQDRCGFNGSSSMERKGDLMNSDGDDADFKIVFAGEEAPVH